MKSNRSKKLGLGLSVALFGIVGCIGLAGTRPTSEVKAEGAAKKFFADFSTLADAVAEGRKLNVEIAREGNILLKNKDNMLPFASSVKKVTVFGQRSRNEQRGGSGSGSSSYTDPKDIYDSLEAAGYQTNHLVRDIYDGYVAGLGSDKTPEAPLSVLTTAEGSYDIFGDAAFIVVSRTGSEFTDNKVSGVSGHSDATDHVLMLQDGEKELINYVAERFSKVVLVVNSPAAMELAEVQDDPRIGGILWVGLTADVGMMAVGEIMNGTVNPSGKTVDVWAANFKKDPTWQNFGSNSQVAESTLAPDGKTSIPAHGVIAPDGNQAKSKYQKETTLDYEEGIYMGYRWYETAAAEGVLTDPKIGYEAEKGTLPEGVTDQYYNRSTGVVYPFGFGLSYTTFSWEMTQNTITNWTKDSVVEVSVKITNTGSRAGKEVVQIYSSPEYHDGGIEKAAANLVDFQKTKLLAPGESQTLTFKLTVQQLASFDYNDANANSHQGYELEAGSLKITARSDSHTVKATANYTVDNTVKITNDEKTGGEIKAVFSQDDKWNTNRRASIMKDGTSGLVYTSRHDLAGTFPKAPEVKDREFTQEFCDELYGQELDYAYEDKETDPWYKDASWGVGKTQATADQVAARENGKTAIQLKDMTGVAYEDASWETFMNQLSYAEIKQVVSNGSFSTQAINSVGKAATIDNDGPAQLKASGTALGSGQPWLCEVNIASTWNVEIARKQGLYVGNESLLAGINGWYGPAMNTHRNPLAGRNFEYYSQDGVHGGKIAAAVIGGAQSKGVHVYAKHFFMNDQEQDRYGICTWANEQAIREIYLKQFELPVKEANLNGTMAAFNRIGGADAGNYMAYEIMRNEFGFRGASNTDMYGTSYFQSGTADSLLRAGVYPLGSWKDEGRTIDGDWSEAENCVMVSANAEEHAAKTLSTKSYTQWWAVRETAKQIFYVHCNNNGMQNGYTDALPAATVTGKVGTALTASLVDATSIGAVSAGSCTLISGSLPAGVALSSTGKLSGTPSQIGTFSGKVRVALDGWVSKTVDLEVTIAGSGVMTLGEIPEIKVGDNVELTVGKAGTTNPGTNISVIEGELPEGLSISNGVISGKATKAGTYTFTLYAQAGSGWRVSRYYDQFTITVAEGDPVEEPEEGKTIVSVTPTDDGYIITFSDGTSIEVKNGKDGKDGVDGKDGADGQPGAPGADGKDGKDGTNGKDGVDGQPGAPGADGKDGKDGKDGVDGKDGAGCGGSIIASSSMIAALAGIGIAIATKKKKED